MTLSTSAGSGLLLQRFGELAGALTQLVEQPRVLDGDHRLVGEGLHQRDLLVGEGSHLLCGRCNAADSSFPREKRNHKNARYADILRRSLSPKTLM